MAWLRLIRLPNLLILGLCQWLVARLFVRPALTASGRQPELDPPGLAGMILATLCLAACGYVFNDLRDLPADRINRPDRPLPAGQIALARARRGLVLLLAIGLGAALTTARITGQWTQLWLFPAAATGLYLYSTRGKGSGLAGNLLISLFCAAAAGLPAWAERKAVVQLTCRNFWILLSAFLGFAFLLTLFRELVKDMEDRSGDAKQGYATFPLRHGPAATKRLAGVIGWIALAGILILMNALEPNLSRAAWLIGGILLALPAGSLLFLLFHSENQRQFRTLSQFIKWHMAIGIAVLSFFAKSIL